MGNYCFLLAGTSDALDAYRGEETVAPEPAVRVIAAQANALPVLWLQMFNPADLLTAGLDDPNAPATVALRTTQDLAFARLSADPPPFAVLFPPGPALRQWCDLLATAVRESPCPFVEADLSEYSLLTPDPAEFAEELRTFFSDLGRPPEASLPPRGGIARLLFGEPRPRAPLHPAHGFLRNHCPGLNQRIALPSPRQCRSDPNRFGQTVACLVGAGWDHLAPWERP